MERFRAAQPYSMVGGVLLALAMTLHSPLGNIACWWGGLFAWQCIYFVFTSRLLRIAAAGQGVSPSHFRLFVMATLLAAAWWGSAVWWLVPDNDPLYLIVVLLWLAGVAAAYAAYLTGVKSLPVLVLGVMLLIVQAKLWVTGVPVLRLAGMSVLLFTAVLVTMTWPLHRYLRESYTVREENNRLLQDMTEQQQKLDDSNRQLEQQGRQLDEALARVEALVAHDPLTGVLSRRAVMTRAEQLLSLAVSGQPFCLAMLDLDHFKSINDGFGHLVGDEVLRQTCRLVSGELRCNDSLGRYGGEEFMLLLEGMAQEAALLRLEQIRCTVQQHDWSALVGARGVTASIGLVAWQNGLDVPQLIKRADTLLYAAKRAGRNRVMTEAVAEATARGAA
jgi:diguanylate cyclase (GGDEF)-like protein